MTIDRWHRVESLCHAALARTPDERAAFLAEACADDKYAALDIVLDKLMERLRRRNDRRQVHRGRRTPESVASATARTAPTPFSAPLDAKTT